MRCGEGVDAWMGEWVASDPVHIVWIEAEASAVGRVHHDHGGQQLLLGALQVVVQDLENLGEPSQNRSTVMHQIRDLLHPGRHDDTVKQQQTMYQSQNS